MKLRLVALFLLFVGTATEVRAEEKTSVGLGLGLVDASGIGSTLWLTGNVRFAITDRVVLEPELGYWSKSDSFFGVDVSISDLNFGANALYRIPKDKVTFHVGGGVGLHHLSGKVGVLDLFEESDSETKIGLQLLGGVEYRASETVDIFGRVRLDLISDVNQTKLYAGVRFRM